MCMVELTDQRIVEKGNFRIIGLKQLKRMLHDRVEQCQFLEIPHIKSKIRYFKDKFTATLKLKEASGFGWDDAKGCIIARAGKMLARPDKLAQPAQPSLTSDPTDQKVNNP
ncbi:hypothetical protein LINPERPRIM_LOCUS40862 [Linum perenne]